MSRIGLLVAAACLTSAQWVHALQVVEPVEGQNAFVKISAKETTRIVVEGARIKTLIATEGEIAVEKDEDRGQIFVRPAVLDKPINMRVITGAGSTYNLVMQAVDIPQEDIVIKETFAPRLTGTVDRKATPTNHQKAIKGLMSAMALEEPPKSIDVRPTQQEYALWENTRFVLRAVYSERELVGEKYKLTNTGNETIRLVEQELYRKGVLAVAIENKQVEPGQDTNIYVIRSN